MEQSIKATLLKQTLQHQQLHYLYTQIIETSTSSPPCEPRLASQVMDKKVGRRESRGLTENCQTKLEIEGWLTEIRGFIWWLEGKFEVFSPVDSDPSQQTTIPLKPRLPASKPVFPCGSFPVQLFPPCLLKTRCWCVNTDLVYTPLQGGLGRGSAGRCLFKSRLTSWSPGTLGWGNYDFCCFMTLLCSVCHAMELPSTDSHTVQILRRNWLLSGF